ncbi:SH3 domain-containing protein [Bacillus sp. JJ634]
MKKLGNALILSTSILIGVPTVSMMPLGITTVEASSAEKISKTSYQTTANLNLRSGASTKTKLILTIPKGKIVTSTEKKGTWSKVSYTYKSKGKNITKTGWVSNKYLKEHYQYSTIKTAYFFTQKRTSLYSTPDTKKKQVTTVSSNNGFYSKQKIINSTGQTWYRIAYKGKTMYVNSSDVKKNTFTSFSEKKYKAKKDTFLYEFYGNAHKKLVQVPQDASISSSKRIGDWYSVRYAGKTGYVYIGEFSEYADEITYTYTDTSETFYITTNEANLYAAADSTKEKIATIAANNRFASTQKVENSLGETWYRISYNNQDVYINSQDVRTDSSSDIDIIEEIIPETTFVTTIDVNLHQKPDAASSIVNTISKDTIIVATKKTSNEWYQVNNAGNIGYVSSDILKQVRTGDPMNGREGYQFIDLRTQSLVTAKQIDEYIEKNYTSHGQVSVLTGKGQVFIDAGNKYGVNALYLAAHAIHESAFGTSQISLGKNNLFGFGSYDASPYIASYRFPSIDENIMYIAQQMKATYLNEVSGGFRYKGAYLGFSTKDLNNKRLDANSEGMNFYYASDPNWGKGIARHMQAILPYDKSYYSKAAADKEIQTSPPTPIGSDIFPDNIQAKANQDLVLSSSKEANDRALTLKKGSAFTLLEKANDYWVKVMVEDKIYWTKDINFVEYKKYISVQNLGRTTANDLKVRKGASTSTDIITALDLNTYVHLVLNENGTLTMDSSKKWYKVELTDGTIGWVHSSYIAKELN